MKKGCLLLLFFFCSFFIHAQQLTGFTPDHQRKEYEMEERFLALPEGAVFREHLRELTREPHTAGSARSQEIVEYLAASMEKAGFTAEKFDYDIYLDQAPTDTRIELVTPVRLPLNNKEYVHAQDSFSSHPDLSMGWNAFSGSGDVTAEVVYVNYGRKEDFERLKAMGISPKGKIAIARYGGNFRGYKAKYAQAYGAVGLIIYSDPGDNGYAAGLTYPQGPFADESTIQRGSLLTLDYTGDPLTPFEPALPVEGSQPVKRLHPSEVDFHTIPVAPLPYGSAREILSRMQGAPVPERSWQGGLPFTYRVEGGKALQVRLAVQQDKQLTRCTNVVGTLSGTDYPDEWIILGCHHDAWSFGAQDPNSGTALLLSLAESLGQLAQEGYRPKRSIKIAHWDAEEYGILGSTEWVEQFADELSQKAVAYINLDAAVSGPHFGGAASPTLKQLIIDVTRKADYPADSSQTVYEQWKTQTKSQESPTLGNLGGGSDHVAFYTHIGIPSAGVGLHGASGIYHSAYDNFAWFEKFADPEFVYGPTLEKVVGLMTLRLANADLIPYDISRYATDLKEHVKQAEARIQQYDTTYSCQALMEALVQMDTLSRDFEKAYQRSLAAGNIKPGTARKINRALLELEKSFIDKEGMAFGSWYRSLYASPDPYSGYASWMLPGLLYEASLQSSDQLPKLEEKYLVAFRSLNHKIKTLTAMLQP